MPKTSSNPPRSVAHATFCIERTYPASPAQVFKALTDPAATAKWFTGGKGYTLHAREMQVRPGGRERVQGRWETGVVSTFDAVYHDVVADQRLVYSEQGAFLDGYDDAGSREHGTNLLLDALGRSLQKYADSRRVDAGNSLVNPSSLPREPVCH